ncbi:hypothetical protein GLOTRDRAFT_99782 [Gloeophyllum trabeum ATCC 11539]|uniref:Uncharacterized protein n=1 Tax=Gloeophyllum trabeum (strain ATCC 11539 / FP-39264 / Madison 617) TaxID=670483 RepID=S7RM75_GLOTA|nr:uncharacterized protein GLOTRDRAFT_99782 [Gloeophyllum trabeum ATCC 11539]EPQ55495.1 hypothetical protein GLOTRDRAFT_99782 [Gloeophyllum trabeum ATCC 11539]
MFAFLALAVAPLVAALPSRLDTRQSDGPWCKGLGGGAYDVAYNFTLIAKNATSNDNGVQIVLNPQTDRSGATVYGLATYTTQPGTLAQFPNFSLFHGGLTANEPSNAKCQPVSPGAAEGSAVSFLDTCTDLATAAPVFCAVASTSAAQGSLPTLALNTHTDRFLICRQAGGTADVVVYDASADATAYEYDTCYAVTLHVDETA